MVGLKISRHDAARATARRATVVGDAADVRAREEATTPLPPPLDREFAPRVDRGARDVAPRRSRSCREPAAASTPSRVVEPQSPPVAPEPVAVVPAVEPEHSCTRAGRRGAVAVEPEPSSPQSNRSSCTRAGRRSRSADRSRRRARSPEPELRNPNPRVVHPSRWRSGPLPEPEPVVAEPVPEPEPEPEPADEPELELEPRGRAEAAPVASRARRRVEAEPEPDAVPELASRRGRRQKARAGAGDCARASGAERSPNPSPSPSPSPWSWRLNPSASPSRRRLPEAVSHRTRPSSPPSEPQQLPDYVVDEPMEARPSSIPGPDPEPELGPLPEFVVEPSSSTLRARSHRRVRARARGGRGSRPAARLRHRSEHPPELRAAPTPTSALCSPSATPIPEGSQRARSPSRRVSDATPGPQLPARRPHSRSRDTTTMRTESASAGTTPAARSRPRAVEALDAGRRPRVTRERGELDGGTVESAERVQPLR